MLIKTERPIETRINLYAFTFSSGEFSALEDTLKSAGIPTSFSEIGSDDAGREGRRYYVVGDQIDSLARVLHGGFDPSGTFSPADGTGKTYACREIRPSGVGKGCEQFAAQNDSVAITKCALIAGRNNWFGGDAKPGMCKGSGLLNKFFGR